jgi:hypothetical protein
MVVFVLVAYGLVKSFDTRHITYLPANATILSVTPNCSATDAAKPKPGEAGSMFSGSCAEVAAKVAALPDRVFTTTRYSTSLKLGFVTAEGKPVRAESYASTLGLADDVQPGKTVRIFYQNTSPQRVQSAPPGAFDELKAVLALLGLLLVSGYIAFFRRR